MAQRIAIATQFGISKTGSTHVSNNEIADDGYKVVDIETGLSRENLQNFLETDETDLETLWNFMLAKMFPEDVDEATADRQIAEVAEALGTVTEADAVEILAVEPMASVSEAHLEVLASAEKVVPDTLIVDPKLMKPMDHFTEPEVPAEKPVETVEAPKKAGNAKKSK